MSPRPLRPCGEPRNEPALVFLASLPASLLVFFRLRRSRRKAQILSWPGAAVPPFFSCHCSHDITAFAILGAFARPLPLIALGLMARRLRSSFLCVCSPSERACGVAGNPFMTPVQMFASVNAAIAATVIFIWQAALLVRTIIAVAGGDRAARDYHGFIPRGGRAIVSSVVMAYVFLCGMPERVGDPLQTLFLLFGHRGVRHRAAWGDSVRRWRAPRIAGTSPAGASGFPAVLLRYRIRSRPRLSP